MSILEQSAGRLALDIRWDHRTPDGSADRATMGNGLLYLDGMVIWGERPTGNSRVRWSWIDLLEHLAEHWAGLFFERDYPCKLNPTDPRALRFEAERRWKEEKRWGGLSEETLLDQDEEIFQFEERHDLARGMKGIVLPSLFAMVEDGWMRFSTEGKLVHIPLAQAVRDLEDIGDMIAARLRPLACERAAPVIEAWDRRWPDLNLAIVSRYTGCSPARVEGWMSGNGLQDLFGANDNQPLLMNQCLAAARMAADQLSDDSMGKIIAAVRECPARFSARLDDLSREAEAHDGNLFAGHPPYKQGYELARWFRAKPGVEGEDRTVDPAMLLRDLGVPVIEVDIPEPGFEALGVWGPSHGPAVLINRNGLRFSHAPGRRSILAHELCHLLIDRRKALPLGEVLDGRINKLVEQRARAFGAEFLIPSGIIREALANREGGASMEEWLYAISLKFGASHEMIALQIHNLPDKAGLAREEVEALRIYAPQAADWL
ncbi:MAG TPA: ImmA/IrrE family metallo-endopeptidase [Azospirillaceae bacterium]|nr:ImmA/IrrE family metallo-endopeptidase [Azospirillaceae bacterium]